MNTIPSHIIIKEEDLDSLDEMYRLGQSDDDIALLRIDFTKFLKSAYATIPRLSGEVEKKEIEKSYFLRLLLDKWSNQGLRTRKIPESHDLYDSPWDKDILFNLTIKSGQNLSFKKPNVSLNKFPNDWKRLSNQKKTIYKVGGPGSDFSSWKGLNLNKLPVKNLLIVDPYLLEDLNLAKINLGKMLEGLLDPRGSGEVSFMIIVRYDQRVSDYSLKKTNDHKELNDLLKAKFPNFTFDLSIAYIKKSFTHDRYLFSDLYYMSCQGGFNFYRSTEKLDSNRSNDLNIYFLSDLEVTKSFFRRLTEISGWLKSSNSLYDSVGNLESGLFDVL